MAQNKWTPLIFAANMRPRVAKKGEVEAQVQIAQMLIEANADLDMQDLVRRVPIGSKLDCSLMHRAAARKHSFVPFSSAK